MRERVTTDQIKLARTVDLISYMQRYEPEELIRTGPHDYKTATHSSLCISDNGLWHWYSRGIGGRGALNYLIQVKGMDFVSAVRHLCELELPAHAPFQPVKKNPQHEYERKPFLQPLPDSNAETVVQYLKRRGIDGKILKYCINQGMLRIYCALLEIFAILPWVAQMGARKGVNLESRRKRILTVVPHAVNDVNDVVLNGSIARDRAIC